MVYEVISNIINTAIITIFPTSRYSYTVKRNLTSLLSKKHSVYQLSLLLNNNNNYNYDNKDKKDHIKSSTTDYSQWKRTHLARNWYSSTREGRIQLLYKYAIQRLHGYEIMLDKSNCLVDAMRRSSSGSSSSRQQTIIGSNKRSSSMDNNWRGLIKNIERLEKAAEEDARSALMLAMMMVDDIMNTKHEQDSQRHFWGFSSAPLIAQPILMLLGYLEINSNHRHDRSLSSPSLSSSSSIVSSIDMNYFSNVQLRNQSSLIGTIPLRRLYEALHIHSSSPSLSSSSSSSSSPLPSLLESDTLSNASVTSRNSCIDKIAVDKTELLKMLAQYSSENISLSLSSSPIQSLLLACGVNVSMLSDTHLYSRYSSDHSNRDEEVASSMSVSGLVDDMISNLSSNSRANEANTCRAAASYYFSVVQYVNVHYGTSHSGIGTLEELRWMDSDGKTTGHQGEADIHIQHVLAEANNGNAEALTFIAKKYYWGSSGLVRNVTLSRTYFEKASQLGDSEAMYNMGILYESGQGGLVVNLSRAIEYYKQAANATKPYQKAIHSLGLHYLANTIERNFILAKTYFIQAAKLNSEEAHYELGLMYLNGQGSLSIDIPRATAHFAVAASMGHFKAINVLSLALYDSSTSWLSQYGRSNLQRYRRQIMIDALTKRAQQNIDEKKKKKFDDDDSSRSSSGSSSSSSSSMSNDTSDDTYHPRNESILGDDDMTQEALSKGSSSYWDFEKAKDIDHACILNGTCTMSTGIIHHGGGTSDYADDYDSIDGFNSYHNFTTSNTSSSLLSSSSSSSSSNTTTTTTDSTATPNTNTTATNSTYLAMLMSTNETDLLLHSSPYFTDFDFIRVYLPDGSIAPLPFPLGSTDGACESALLLLKHLADMSYRTKDVSRQAIDEYIKKDYWSSIDLLEEASNLGVKSTQENAAYLYEKLLNEKENYDDDDDDDDGDGDECTTGMMDATSRLHSRSGNAFVYCSNKNPLDCCMMKKKKMKMIMMKYASFRQWKKLVQSGEPLAMRKVADSLLYFHSTKHDDNEDDNEDGEAAIADAKMLYLLAAGRGDAQSLMQLGWMLFFGRHGKCSFLDV